MVRVAESMVEQASLTWLKSLGWRVKHGPDIASNILSAAHEGYCVRHSGNTSATYCRSNHQLTRCELRMQKGFKDCSP